MKLFTISLVFWFVFLSIFFSISAKSSSLKKGIRGHIVDKKISSTLECSKDELEIFYLSAERALEGTEKTKLKTFVYELNAIGVKFSLVFEHNSTSDLSNACSTVKYYRKNIRRITRIYMNIYLNSRIVKKYHYGFYFIVKDTNDLNEKICKNAVFRKRQTPHKVKPVKTVLEERFIDLMSFQRKEYLALWQEDYWPMDLFHVEKDKLQLIIKCDYFEDTRFQLFIKSKYTADYEKLTYEILLQF